MYKYTRDNDFLQWKCETPIRVPNITSHNNNSDMTHITKQDLPKIFKKYVDDDISLSDMLKAIEACGTQLNAQQQKVLARCRKDSSVQLSELLLAFRSPKAGYIGNFSSEEAKNSMREPMILRHHKENIITWEREDEQNLPPQGKYIRTDKQFIDRPNILEWNENFSMPPRVFTPSETRRFNMTYKSHLTFDNVILFCFCFCFVFKTLNCFHIFLDNQK